MNSPKIDVDLREVLVGSEADCPEQLRSYLSLQQEGSEQRGSYRFAVPASQQEAELKVGRRRLPVWLFNESSGGFAAWAEKNPKVKPDDVVELFTVAGHFEVRVVYVARVELEAAEGEHAEEAYRLGLERLLELETSPDVNTASRRLPGRLRRPQIFSPHAMIVITLTLAIVATLIATANFLPRTGSPVRGQSGAFNGEPRDSAPGAPRSLKEVVRELGLNNVQQQRFHRVAEITAAAFKELDSLWLDDTPEERERKRAAVLDAALREVQDILNEEQRKKWEVATE